MAFNKYDTFKSLNDSKEDWIIRVRAQIIWKGVTRESGVFRGFNIIFFDDSSERIHAFISENLAGNYEEYLMEGQVYTLKNFKVKFYNGDEPNRAVRYEKHLFFTKDTELTKTDQSGLEIPPHSFDIFSLGDMEQMKKDNRFLTDVVAVIQDIQPTATYIKNNVEKSHVLFTISDGKNIINVTFFNEFGQSFLKAKDKTVQEPVIIIIAAAKCSDYKGTLYLTNFPATRFYLNVDHYSVQTMRTRLGKPNFYVMDMEDDDHLCKLPLMKVTEIKKLKEDYVEKQVLCQLTVKKVDEKMNWYIPICTNCDIEVPYVDGKYKCINEKCGRTYPYPDRRFQLYTLCSDETGTIPVVWPNDEICRIIGKTVYDLDVDETQVGMGDKFPPLLKFCHKKSYKFTIRISEENIKQGSNIYRASYISEPMEMTGTNSPMTATPFQMPATEITMPFDVNDQKITDNSPPTGKSSNKIRSRINLHIDTPTEGDDRIPKYKNIKTEKM